MIGNNPTIENAAEYLNHPYANIKANAYDMVLNGNEIGGGSIRIFQRELQEKMFAALGMDEEEQRNISSDFCSAHSNTVLHRTVALLLGSTGFVPF